MRTSIIILCLASIHGAYSNGLLLGKDSNESYNTTACHANNCLRGLRGTGAYNPPSLASRSADCSSFMATTVTPAAFTTITTLTLTGPQATTFAPNITFTAPAVNVTASPKTVIARNAKPKPRFVPPRQGFNQTSIYVDEVPVYATYCPDASAYSSACSCIGITQATITAAAATFVSTVVETLTPITTVTPVVTYTPTVVITSTVTITPITCSTGKTFCGDTCVDLTQDDNNCGACSNACGTGLICSHSSCVLPSIYFCSPTNQQRCGSLSCGGRCFASVTGQGYCKAIVRCSGLQHCTTGDECPSTVCLKNNCGTVCAESDFLCANNGTTKFLFGKREGRVEGKANLVETEVGWVDEAELGYGGGSGRY